MKHDPADRYLLRLPELKPFTLRIGLTLVGSAVLLGSLAAPRTSVSMAMPAVAEAPVVSGGQVDPAAPGTITGTVTVEQRPARRRARRYTGGRTAPARVVQRLPMVAYLKGRVAGGDASGRPVMAQEDTAFAPGVMAIEVGASVDFPNHDMFFHNVFSYSKTQRFDLGRYPKGESKTVTFRAPGVVKIYCEVHEFMRAAILVLENRHHRVVDSNGGFTLEGIPAGSYELVIWHPDLDEVVTSVTVPEGGTVQVAVTIQ